MRISGAWEARQAEARARIEELERIRVPERINWIEGVRGELAKFYPPVDGVVERYLNQCAVLVSTMLRDIDQPYHAKERAERDRLEALLHRIERRIERIPKAKGGRDRADKNKAAATEWQQQIEREVKRMLRDPS